MTAVPIHTSPVSGRTVPYWRTSCGSFVTFGWNGRARDYVTEAFLRCSDPDRRPNIIRMGIDVYESYLISLLDTISVPAEDESPADALRRVLNFVPHELTLYGATVVVDRDLNEQTIEMYRDDVLLAELTGWTR